MVSPSRKVPTKTARYPNFWSSSSGVIQTRKVQDSGTFMKFGRRSVTLNAYRILTGGPDEANRHQQLPCARRAVSLRCRPADHEECAAVDARRETTFRPTDRRNRRFAARPCRQGLGPPDE